VPGRLLVMSGGHHHSASPGELTLIWPSQYKARLNVRSVTLSQWMHNSVSASVCLAPYPISRLSRISGAARIVASILILGGVPVTTAKLFSSSDNL
jgi:hypothetical protein